MNFVVDIILLIILVSGAVHGYKRGFILELIGIAAFIIAIYGGLKLLHRGMEHLSKLYDGFGVFLPFLSFMLIFVVIVILVNILGEWLKKIIDWTPLGIVDNVAGALVNLLKTTLGIGIVFWVMQVLEISFAQNVIKHSKILPVVQSVLVKIGQVIALIFPSFDSFIETLKEFLKSFIT